MKISWDRDSPIVGVIGGTWFSLEDAPFLNPTSLLSGTNQQQEPDVLCIVPLQFQDDELMADAPKNIRTRSDYFAKLANVSIVAIKNVASGQYLSCRRRDVTDIVAKQRFIAEYCQGKSTIEEIEETEKFEFLRNPKTGGYSLRSTTNKCYLTIRKRGGFAFKGNKTKEEAEWLINPILPNAHETSLDERILFVGVVDQEKKSIISRHALNCPVAWRTEEGRLHMLDQILCKMKNGTSTVVIDSDTGNQWYATQAEEGDEVYLAITTTGFPSYYGAKCVMALEALCKEQNMLRDNKVMDDNVFNEQDESSLNAELVAVMRVVETEYMCSEIHELSHEVQKLKHRMLINLAGLQKNYEKVEDILEKSEALAKDAELFEKLTGTLPGAKNRHTILAASLAVGVAGALVGWSVGGPALPLLLETQAIEIILGTLGGAATGYVSASIYTSIFWKRCFIHLGRCINSRGGSNAYDANKED